MEGANRTSVLDAHLEAPTAHTLIEIRQRV